MQNNQNDGGVNDNKLTIKKSDLAQIVQRNTGMTKTDSAQIIDQIITRISDSLASGDNVKLSNFGTFQLLDKAGRIGRNPKTNKEVSIAPRRVVSFKASSKLIQRVMKANANSKANHLPRQITDKKKDVLSALGNKIGSPVSDLEFIFNSASASQVQKDVQIPDIRKFNS